MAMTPENSPFHFVGYIRVSTERQADDGNGLCWQADAIRRYVEKRQGKLVGVYQDVGSAAGSRSAVRRPGLNDALKVARNMGAPLLITDPSRLSRNLHALQDLDLSGIKIINVTTGRSLGLRHLRKEVADRAATVGNIQNGSAAGVRSAKRRGAYPGNRTNLRAAQRRGSIENAVRADEKIRRLADALEKISDWEMLPRKVLVEQLNASGSRNVLRTDEPAGEPWRLSTLRQPLKKAVEELSFRRELEEHEDAALSFPVAPGQTDADRHPDAVVAPDQDENSATDEDRSTDEEPDVFYRKNPLYGRFF